MYFEYKNIIKLLVGTVFCFTHFLAWADTKDVSVLKEVVVTSKQEKLKSLPSVDGAKIYSGKKTSVIDLEESERGTLISGLCSFVVCSFSKTTESNLS